MSTFLFVGVTTGQSSSLRTFPAWMEILGHSEVQIKGVDLPLGAPPPHYRAVVERVKANPSVVGALVTSHKIDLLNAARDLIDELDVYAVRSDEVSGLAKRGDRLIGYATDPVAGGRSLREILGDGYFARTGGEVLCLGAGGAGTALALALMDWDDGPARFTAVDVDPGRLKRFQSIVAGQTTEIEFRCLHHHSAQQNDGLLATLTRGSVVINATGLGKDRPGSPITDAALFPPQGVAWELNYRGALDFLHQARRQADSQNLHIADGWRYFLHGWLSVIERVLDLEIDSEAFQRCAGAAAEVR